jgi:16S rRNA (cytosine1402-N4)-methyltransferase
MPGSHQPVLYQEVLIGLRPTPGGKYIDGTLGAGGHAAGLLALSSPDGQLLGMDLDPAALEVARRTLEPFGARARIVQGSYTQMAEVAKDFAPADGSLQGVDGILLDLGLSSLQVDDPTRGFAFRLEGPLDMRFDPQAELTAAEIVNEWPEAELADVLYQYGEERQSRKIARAIGAAQPLHTTRQLAEVVAEAIGGQRGAGRLHPATRTFQALRIAVNGELEAVETVLPVAVSLLKPGGRLAVISFHSLEDRIVKTFFRQQARATDFAPAPLKEITRKPVVATDDEVARNPRARSARLRIVEKV